MLADVVPLLECPACESALTLADGAMRCPAAHAYDVARQGYVTLRRSGASGGDSAAMVMARERFLASGHFAGLADLLAERAAQAGAGTDGGTDGGPGGGGDGCVVDVGAGTGYNLAAVLDRLPGRVGLALDASPYALRRAARAHPRAGAVGCDAWQRLPVRSGVTSLLLNVFAPRNGAEFRRIARPGATLLLVTPTPRHLAELVAAAGLLTVDPSKDERLERVMHGHFTLVGREEYEVTMRLSPEEATAMVAMGPTAWHADRAALVRRLVLPEREVTVTGSFRLLTYRAGG